MLISNKELVQRLDATKRGRIILCNVLDGYQAKLFTRETIRVFFDWWCKAFPIIAAKKSKDPLADPLFDTLDLLRMEPSFWAGLYGDIPGLAALGGKPDFRSLCRRVGRYNRRSGELITVMPTEAFFLHLAADVRDLCMGTGLFDTTCDGTSVKAAVQDATGGFWAGKMARADRLKPGACLGPPSGVFWFTAYGELKEAINYHDADGVRDLLGLIHLDDGDSEIDLIGIAFSASAFKSDDTHGRPTMMDAGSNRRYKARTFLPRYRRRSFWGFTGHLGKLADSEGVCDGAAERVALPIDSAELGTVTIYPIGRTTIFKKRGRSPEDNDEAFADGLRRHRDFGDIEAAVLALL